MVLKINNHIIDNNHSPYIIAELSANHNGSLDRALKTIEEAKLCGAHAIKIQTYNADTMTIDCDYPDFIIKGGLWSGFKLYDLYKWTETPFEWQARLFEYAKKIGITIFSTPFDETAVDLLEKLNTPAYKIASFEIVDLPLIAYVASKGKPIIMSTGMASEKEIDDAVITARASGCSEIILLHCISSYPTPIENANIKQITNIANRFNVITGLSDHTLGTTASVAAVAQGACIIEKHFTLDRSEKGPDSEFSLEPDEFKKLCIDVKDAWLSLGKGGFTKQRIDEDSKIFRRSIYFIKDLPAGHIICQDDIRRIRPGGGLAPKYFSEIIGRVILKKVNRGQAVRLEDLGD